MWRGVVAVVVAWLVGLVGSVSAAVVEYRVGFVPGGKSWDVDVRFPSPYPGEVDFRVPRWTPGAYHLAEYGRWVKTLSATSGNGDVLEVRREAPSHWVIAAGDHENIVVNYKATSMSKGGMEMKVIDVEANRVSKDYAFLSPASLLGFVPGLMDKDVSVEIALPEGWQAATALLNVDGKFVAPSYYRLEDSPFFLSATQTTTEFEVGGIPHFVTVYGASGDQAKRINDACRDIVVAAGEIMNGLPYERYHFLIALMPEAMGAGLEHSESTLIMASPMLPESDLWGMVAHELFHAWVAERMHVEAIHRPDFVEPLDTTTIWFNEGFTEYMARHILLRAGLLDESAFFASFTRRDPQMEAMLKMVGNRPWTEVSRSAGEEGGMKDLIEFSMKCYEIGPRVILALDLEMRRVSGGERGIIDLLRFMQHAYVERDRAFAEDEVLDLIEGIAQAEFDDFYGRYIAGIEEVDLAHVLDVIGYDLGKGKDRRAVLRAPLEEGAARARADFFGLPPVVAGWSAESRRVVRDAGVDADAEAEGAEQPDEPGKVEEPKSSDER